MKFWQVLGFEIRVKIEIWPKISAEISILNKSQFWPKFQSSPHFNFEISVKIAICLKIEICAKVEISAKIFNKRKFRKLPCKSGRGRIRTKHYSVQSFSLELYFFSCALITNGCSELHVAAHCAKTCNRCPAITSECEDHNIHCQLWRANCQHHFVNMACPATCGICD